MVPLDEFSLVTAPYQVNGQVIGTSASSDRRGMAYDRVIPIVDLTAKAVVVSHAARNGLTAPRSPANAGVMRP